MNYKKISKLILLNKEQKWWRNYPPSIYIHRKKISTKTVKFYLEKVFNKQNANKIGLYIHIPFCRYRCNFCRYYSKINWDKNTMSEYVKSIEKELFLYKIDFKKHSLQSIYFGGGTPTLLYKENWIELFKIINKFFKIEQNAQILVEATPETCTFSKLKLLKDLGVNRLTIGAQTFDEKILNSLNRRHSIADIYKAFKNARKAGIKYLNMDLLFGLPGETKKSFLDTLKCAAEIKANCISPAFLDLNERVVYSKEDFKNTYINAGRKEKDMEAEAFSEMQRFFKKKGYVNEINGVRYTSFLLQGETSAFNKNILPKGSFDSAFAIGCHANSYINYFEKRPYQLQYQGVKLEHYISSVKNGRLPYFSGTELLEDEIIRQYIIYCFIFFHEKINKEDFLKWFNKDIMSFLKTNSPKLLKDNKVREDKNFVYFFRKKPYVRTNRDKFLFFCIKYLYSPKVLKILEKEARDKIS